MSTGMTRSARRNRIQLLPATAILTLVAISAVFPLIFLVGTALRTPDDYLRGPGTVPHAFTFANIADAWNQAGLGRLALNSLIVVSIADGVVVLISAMAAFSLIHLPLPSIARQGGRIIAVVLLALPASVLIVPIFEVVLHLHLLNTYVGLILVYASLGSPFGIYMLSAYFQQVPTELLQAAEIDGAGVFRRFMSIGMPLARPAIAALGALTALSLWNDLLFSLLILQQPNERTLTVGVSLLQSSFSASEGNTVLSAGLLLAIVPPLLIFALMNRSLMKGLVAGAVK